MSCHYLNCTHAPTYTCSCGNICKSLCDKHINEHVKDSSHFHNATAISTRKILIKYLNASLSYATSAKSELCKAAFALVKSIEKKTKSIFEQFSAFEAELNSLILNIAKNQPLAEGNLTRIIEMSPQNAEAECAKWRFISCNFDVSSFASKINSWNPVICSLESLYAFANLQEIPSNVNYMQANKRDSSLQPRVPEPESNFSKFLKSHLTLPKCPATAKTPMNPPGPFNPPKVFQPENKQSLIISSMIPNLSIQSLPLPPAAQQLYCQKSHILVFNPYTTFLYWEQKGFFWVSCSICGKSSSQSSWNCSPCNYDVCGTCALQLGFKFPKLVCDQNHELEFRYDVFGYYCKRGFGTTYICKNCKSNKNEPHWHCRLCHYDLCTQCAERKGFSPFLSKAKCQNFHTLVPSLIDFSLRAVRLATICNICKVNIIGDIFECKPCSYHLCVKCKNFIERNIAQHPVFVCGTGHYLNWVSLREMTCNYCFRKSSELFVCVSCEFKVCMDCGQVLLKVIRMNEKKSHCGQEMKWSPRCTEADFRNKNRECTNCRIRYEQNGMFSCGTCGLMVCVLCYDQPERQQTLAFIRDNVLIVNALGN